MTSDPTDNVTASYDAENRIASASTASGTFAYTYDADGNRVEKSGGGSGTLYWYMTPGIVAESDLAGNLKSEYVFFNDERVARRDFDPSTHAPTGVFYYFSDHLKTASVITDSAGNIKSESDYYPWGGELQFVNNDSNHYKFTGKERDTESGLDYFGARYYSNGLGRFISADWSATPIPVPYADFGDPESLNLYTYVRNIPTVNADPSGHEIPNVDADISRTVDSVSFLGQEIFGGVKALVNAVPATYNAAASFLNEQITSSPNLQDVPTLPLAPTLPINGPGQAVGAAVTNVAIVVAAGTRNSGTSDPEPAPYNRTEHYGNPSSSPVAKEIRANGEGQACPTCNQTMKSGTKTAPTAEHQPTLKQHYYKQDGAKMTKAQRRGYAKSAKSMEKDAVCITCQRKQGGAESHKKY